MSKYKTLEDFVFDCATGLDIEFSYAGAGYGIFGWFEDGPLAYRKDEYGYYEKQFKTIDELLDGFIISGKSLREIITEIEDD